MEESLSIRGFDMDSDFFENDESYTSDLQLAAEMGKILLQRNQDLEKTFRNQQDVIDEYVNEIQFLSSHIESLKELSESRLQIYEQLEVNVAELEKANQSLLTESHADQLRIKSLNQHIYALELKNQELKNIVLGQRTRQQMVGKEISKTLETFRESVKTPRRDSADYSGHTIDTRKLKTKVSNLTAQLFAEKRRFEALEAQTIMAMEESSSLKDQVRSLCNHLETQQQYIENRRMSWSRRRSSTLEAPKYFHCDFLQDVSVEGSVPIQPSVKKTPVTRYDFKDATDSIFERKEDFYDSGYEDISSATISSCSSGFQQSLECPSRQSKSLYEELAEADPSFDFNSTHERDKIEDKIESKWEDSLSVNLATHRLVAANIVSRRETEKYCHRETQTSHGKVDCQTQSCLQDESFSPFWNVISRLKSGFLCERLMLGFLQNPNPVGPDLFSSELSASRREAPALSEVVNVNDDSEVMRPKKKYKSIFMRRPFFAVPSPSLLSVPFLKIGLPLALTQGQVISNAFK